jgi:hypothetical protein
MALPEEKILVWTSSKFFKNSCQINPDDCVILKEIPIT